VHITKATLLQLNDRFQVEAREGGQREGYLADHKVETYLIIPPTVSTTDNIRTKSLENREMVENVKQKTQGGDITDVLTSLKAKSRITVRIDCVPQVFCLLRAQRGIGRPRKRWKNQLLLEG
jgi:adenylate cyclase 2